MKTILSALTLSLLLSTAMSANAAPLKATAPQAVVTPAVAKGPSAGDWRVPDPENVVVIDTTKGRIIVELSPELAPNHVARFKELTREGFYNGLKFHRVIDEFMSQTGDPMGTGEGGSTKPDVVAEFTYRRGPQSPFTPISQPIGIQSGFVGAVPIMTQIDDLMAITADGKVHAWGQFCPGVLGAARGENPDSANSQFFLMRQAFPSLDKRYTAYGQTLSGLNIVRAIKTGEPVVDPDTMTKVQMLADIAAAERPSIKVLDVRSGYFKTMVETLRTNKGADFSACDIDLPVEVR
jgi:peptidylprolyl isomerase